MAAVALSRLLPTLGSSLPPRLLDTADSLLALSRQRAPNLKRDEEVARAHACAEIACGRLREKLRLPPLKTGTAPVSEKVYRKLYGFLERVLGGDVKGGETSQGMMLDKGKRKRGVGEALEGGTPVGKKQRGTGPVIESLGTGTRTPKGFVGKVKDVRMDVKGDEQEAPLYVLPSIRRLCKAFGTQEMVPHVYTGACVVLQLTNLWPRPSLDEATTEDLEVTDEMFEANVTALVVALYLMVLTRMMREKMTRKTFKSISTKANEVLEGRLDEKGVESWVKRINKEAYAKGQGWWESVPEEVFDFVLEQIEAATVADGEEEGINGDEDGVDGEREELVRKDQLNLEPDPEGVLLPGLGTMMQEAVDWTSEDLTREFRDWKSEMLERLDSMPIGTSTVAVH